VKRDRAVRASGRRNRFAPVAGGSRPLFCRQSNRAITAERADAILDRYSGESPDIGSHKSRPVVDVPMPALEEIYPAAERHRPGISMAA
jgi:hypothetical protein